MNGLAFREFLEIETGNKFPVYSLDDILIKHTRLAQAIVSKIKHSSISTLSTAFIPITWKELLSIRSGLVKHSI
ncbi:MAG: hypothetical protein H8D65_03030 [Spirochaetes bacterium]|nr:hypothetical protein [Spirochaetota bacterium]